MTTWSYSKVNSFKQCPKKYYHMYVKKDVKDTGSVATRYGNFSILLITLKGTNIVKLDLG